MLFKYPIFLVCLVVIMLGVCYQQQLGERQIVQACFMRAEAGWSGLCKQNTDSESCLHNPSPCGWVIVSYQPVMLSFNGGSHSASLISGQAQYNLITTTEIEQHYDSLISVAADLGLFDIKAVLESQKLEKLSQYSSFYNNGVQTLSAKVDTEAQGSCVDRQSGWIDLYYQIVQEFVGCTVSDLTKELESDPDFLKVLNGPTSPTPKPALKPTLSARTPTPPTSSPVRAPKPFLAQAEPLGP